MTIDWNMTPSAWWMLIGVLLVLADFVVVGIIAVFFGAAAIVVAILLFLGVPLSLNMQILLFGALGIVLILVVRKHVKFWFLGKAETATTDVEDSLRGSEVTANEDFVDARGAVQFRGVRWNAECIDTEKQVKQGMRLWIVERSRLLLKVQTRPLDSPHDPH